MKYLFMSLFICVYIEIVTSLFCYWDTGCPYKFFGSKTPYNAIRGDIRDSVVKIRGCEPISIWGLHRHGKRNPGPYFGNHMKQALLLRDYIVSSYKEGKSSLCAQDVENLRDWQVDNNMFERHHQLTDEGYQEMLGLARRLKQTFPKLLTNLVDGSYIFHPVFGKTIKDSGNAFLIGLDEQNLILQNATEDFDIMAPYTTCGKYQRDIIQNPNLYDEAVLFLNTSDYLIVKDRIQRRTGIEYTLTDQNVTSLYDLCRYSSSGIDSRFSPWCALFTTDDLQVLEYIDDLRHYYRNGYGSALSEKFGRLPLRDLLESFQLAKDGKEKKIATYFTHGTMIDMVYTSLGLFKDENFITGAHRNPNRRWRSTKMSTFAANLIAVLKRCTSDGKIDFRVVFYKNEEPLRTICKEGICSWEEFKDTLSPFVNSTTDFCEFQTKPLEFIRYV